MPDVSLICKECGVQFWVPYKERFDHSLCSDICRSNWHRKHAVIVHPTPEMIRRNADVRRGSGLGLTYIKRDNRHEHRIIAEWMLGRPLVAGEIVHHKNGNKRDNRPENLEVLSGQDDHARIHGTKTHCKYGHEFTPENTRYTCHGHKICRTCNCALQKRYYQLRIRNEDHAPKS